MIIIYFRRRAEGRKGLGYSIFNRSLLFSGFITGLPQRPLPIFIGQWSAVNGCLVLLLLKRFIVAVRCQNLSARGARELEPSWSLRVTAIPTAAAVSGRNINTAIYYSL